MKKYEDLAKTIIKDVGGQENVNSLTHCITRLRFKLKNENIAKTDEIKQLDGVVTVMKSAGQYQVVIGNAVGDVFDTIMSMGLLPNSVASSGDNNQTAAADSENAGDGKKKNLFNAFIDLISGIFTPILGLLCATGMIKGFNAMFVAFGLYNNTSGNYQILNMIGDSFFYFLPIFLGYSSAKKFNLNPFIGMTIAASMVYPTIAQIMNGRVLYTLFSGTPFSSPVHITFLGIPVILMTYSSSVIPIILATYFASKVEKFFNRIIPTVVKMFIVPCFTLLITVPITFIVIGPVATWAGRLLGDGIFSIYHVSPLIAGLLLGGLWQVLVIFGLHWGISAIAFNNIAVLKYDPLLAFTFPASFAQTGVVLSMLIKTKDKKLRSVAIPAFVSGIFGVTEPAIYGVTLPRKKPFLISCISAAVGGAIVGATGGRYYVIGGLGIFGFPNFISPTSGFNASFIGVIIAVIVSFLLALVLGLIFYNEKTVKNDTTETNKETTTTDSLPGQAAALAQETIFSPVAGTTQALSTVPDKAFASGALGDGIAIDPSQGQIFAPADGTITAFFPTKHALGITTDKGTEILIHVGINTVELKGKGFTAHAKQGDKVKKGDLLLDFDIDLIKKSGYSPVVMVIITKTDSHLKIAPVKEEKVQNQIPIISTAF
ncbi:beta-glucoside-specific PTS transporter subunit IIABC [Oenococcus alcoholitolerans]|uniref:beta-glucoside-specific PTS transporter subunit IIABC n=1 Tax=Oenococcus alcoholitolerans TaxID=931074 RepID=UPI003F6E84EF